MPAVCDITLQYLSAQPRFCSSSVMKVRNLGRCVYAQAPEALLVRIGLEE